MPQVGDLIRFGMISELRGVQTQNKFLFRVDNLGSDATIDTNLSGFATLVGTAINPICSNKFRLACFTYENLSRNELRQILYVNTLGGRAADAHPQNQVVRINQWGLPQGSDTRPARNAFNLSGVGEDLSTQGRIVNTASFTNLQNLLQGETSIGFNWTLQSMVRGIVQPTIPPPGGVVGYQESRQAAINPTLLKLRSRTSRLCLIS